MLTNLAATISTHTINEIESSMYAVRILVAMALSMLVSISHASIQNDINALGPNGGMVLIPAGVTVVSSTITVPGNILLAGMGPASVLEADPGLSGPIIENADTISGNTGLRFRDFRIDGSPAATPGAGIRLQNCRDIVIRNIESSGCSDGIEIVGNCSDIVIRQCRLHHSGYQGVFVHKGNGVKLDGTNSDFSNAVVTGCTIYSNYFSGIHGRFAHNLRLYDNFIYDHDSDPDDDFAGDDSIKLFQCDDILAAMNTLDESKNAGIEYWGSSFHVSYCNHVSKSDDHLFGTGNGVAFTDGASQGFWSQGYLHLANLVADCVFGPGCENNEAEEGNQNAVVASTCMTSMVYQGLHQVQAIRFVSMANVSRNTGEFDPPQGQEASGIIISGTTSAGIPSEHVNIHANLAFDDRLQPDQMYGMLIRSARYSSASDNIFTGAEIMDLYQVGTEAIDLDNNIIEKKQVRFIVSDAAAPTSDDQLIYDLLGAQGYVVELYDDESPHPGGASAGGMVIISDTVSNTAVDDAYRSSQAAVLIMDPQVAVAMELADTGGHVPASIYITITDISHYITSILIRDGFVQVAGSGATFGYVSGNVVGQTLGEVVLQNIQYTLMTTEKGQLDQQGQSVPARRAFIFTANPSYGNLNSTGENLFLRTVQWVLGAD